jgi:diguanylate cyclase (GGDEF)-like protein/PAS domain S-box-containing protein
LNYTLFLFVSYILLIKQSTGTQMPAPIRAPKDLTNDGKECPEIDFRALAECSSDIVLQLGPTGDLLYISPSATDLLGWSQQELFENHWELIYGEDRSWVLEQSRQLNSGEREESRISFRARTKSGALLWIEGAGRRLHDSTGRTNGLVVSLRDISIQKQLEAELERLARTDGLTGLANRRLFDEKLEQEWAIARREKTHLSLLIADLDHFKRLNDYYGHQAGDECLREVARVIATTPHRPADLSARYGGEELAIILPRTREDGARMIAEHVRKAIKDLRIPHVMNQDHDEVVTASVGAATSLCLDPTRPETHHALIGIADRALYKAKNAGRNRVEFSMLLLEKP